MPIDVRSELRRPISLALLGMAVVGWLLFIVVDFTVGAVGPVDPHWLFLAGSVGAAVAVLRSSSRRAAVTAA